LQKSAMLQSAVRAGSAHAGLQVRWSNSWAALVVMPAWP
jgi:hypothetical protein